MKALIWKEFRETVRPALFVFIVVAAAMGCVILPYTRSVYWGGVPLMSGDISLMYRSYSGFLLLTTFGGAVSGLALGLLLTWRWWSRPGDGGAATGKPVMVAKDRGDLFEVLGWIRQAPGEVDVESAEVALFFLGLQMIKDAIGNLLIIRERGGG